MNNKLVNYSLIFLILVPIFGLKFFIGFLGNILLLIFLIPLLILLIVILSLNFLKSKVKICDQCGTTSLGINNTCINCGADLENINTENFEKPSETTIEVKAEEIK